MDIQEYQSEYRAKVLQQLTDYAREKGYGSVRLLETDDLDEIAPVLLRAYFADSVPDFAQYPAVSLGWSCFVGVALAVLWDSDWEKYGAAPEQPYPMIRDARGWDELDEYVLEEVLGWQLESEEAKALTNFFKSAVELCYTTLRHERIEPGTPAAFQLYGATVFALYKLGISAGLKILGYKLEAVQPQPMGLPN